MRRKSISRGSYILVCTAGRKLRSLYWRGKFGLRQIALQIALMETG
jgi:hypothetical protein